VRRRFLVAEVEEWRIDKRLETKYLDQKFTDIDAAIDRALEAANRRAAEYRRTVQCSSFVAAPDRKKYFDDVLTDQTSAHDPLIGYVPHTLSNAEANVLREKDPDQYIELAYDSMKLHVELMLNCRNAARLLSITAIICGKCAGTWV
jgi:urocanate hydratase